MVTTIVLPLEYLINHQGDQHYDTSKYYIEWYSRELIACEDIRKSTRVALSMRGWEVSRGGVAADFTLISVGTRLTPIDMMTGELHLMIHHQVG